jgi:hydroxymethylpyrimidine/phosphomethylpyrimidine kinase
VLALKAFAKTSIVWDTVLKSSTEYDFLNIENQTVLVKILKNRLITPNYQNHTIISSETNAENIAKMLSAYCAILLKGGHHPEKLVSILYIQEIIPFYPKIIAHRKTWFRLCFMSRLLFLSWKRFKNSMLSR